MACFVELSSNKERITLEQSVVRTLCQLMDCELFLLHLFDGRGDFNPVTRLHGKADGNLLSEDNLRKEPFVVSDVTFSNYLELLKTHPPEAICQQDELLFWPLFSGENCIDLLVLRHKLQGKPDLTMLSAVGCIFSNFLALLDAGERDALTSLYNRRMFDTRLSSLIRSTANEANIEGERRARKPEPTNFLGIIDIDFFKRVNDDFGHLFGDEVLLWMAQHMRQCFRNEDSLFRYGGEEFAVLLTGLTQKQAQDTFERFRKTIATTDFPQIGQITVSIGYSHIDHQANPTLVFGDADKALYYAKENGRNRVLCYQQLLAENLLEVDTQENADIEIF